jgi:hypothetical protein
MKPIAISPCAARQMITAGVNAAVARAVEELPIGSR